MGDRIAACHCGALTLRCEGEPRRISMCHCTDCQRRTGAPFSIAAFYAADRVTASGATATFTRPSASGFDVTFHFCPECGSNVFWRPARMPELVGIAVGAFADPSFPPPQQTVWVGDKHDWIVLPEGLSAFGRNPPPRPG